MLAIASVGMALVQALSARDFFPVGVGMKWTYEETGEDHLTYTYVVEAAKTLGGKEAYPIVIRYQGNPLTTTYYVLDDAGVGIVAEDSFADIYAPPRPLFKLGEGPQTWSYTGQVPFEAGTAPISLTGSSKVGERRKVLGQEVDTIVVTIDATVTPSAKGRSKPQPMTQHQEAVYGRGIGLVEMNMTATVGAKTHHQHLDLVKLQKGRSS